MKTKVGGKNKPQNGEHWGSNERDLPQVGKGGHTFKDCTKRPKRRLVGGGGGLNQRTEESISGFLFWRGKKIAGKRKTFDSLGYSLCWNESLAFGANGHCGMRSKNREEQNYLAGPSEGSAIRR